MNGEQRNIVIVAGICIMLIIGMFAVCSKPSAKRTTNTSTVKKQEQIKEKKDNKEHSSYSTGEGLNLSSGGGGYASSYSTNSSSTNKTSSRNKRNTFYSINEGSAFTRKSILSDKQIKANLEFAKKAKERHKKLREEKIKNILNDPNANPRLKLKAQLISSKDYVNAYFAYERGDYKEAIKYFFAVYKDKNSPPAMKFMALESLEDCARAMKDLELFCTAAKERGKILATEDLSVLNRVKVNDYYEWATKFSLIMHVKKDKSAKDKLVQELKKEYNFSDKEVEEYINEQIDKYETIFEEFES